MYNVTMEPYLPTSFKNVCGLYKILIGPKFYYGSSKDLYNRAYQHIPELRHNKHKNPYMQNAYNKYKEVKFEVIAICEIEQRRELEHKLLQNVKSNTHCMNLTYRTEGPSDVRWSKEARKNMSKKMKGNTNGRFGKGVKRTMSPEAREKQKSAVIARQNKPVVITKPNGETMKFESRTIAAKYFAVPVRTLTNWIFEPNRPRRKYQDWIFKCSRELN